MGGRVQEAVNVPSHLLALDVFVFFFVGWVDAAKHTHTNTHTQKRGLGQQTPVVVTMPPLSFRSDNTHTHTPRVW